MFLFHNAKSILKKKFDSPWSPWIQFLKIPHRTQEKRMVEEETLAFIWQWQIALYKEAAIRMPNAPSTLSRSNFLCAKKFHSQV